LFSTQYHSAVSLMGKLLQKMKKVSLKPSPISLSLSLSLAIRLDELLKRNCEVAAAKGTSVDVVRIANANSHTSSTQSSHSPSVAGESIDVKVEITPAPPTPMSDIQNSFSIESTSSLTLCSDVSSKSTSPNTRKMSELPAMEGGGFLNPIGNFNRINPSPPNTASARLFKKLEEMIDLSLPYNHYRCLSPSETNLAHPLNDRIPHLVSPNSDVGKPGSSRLLRRQFSLDKDDLSQKHHGNLETISSLIETSRQQNFSLKSQYQPLISSSSLPASSAAIMQCSNKLQKHQSSSVSQDLEKIEEINIDNAMSPNNSAMSVNTSDVDRFMRSSNNNSSFRHASFKERNEFKFL
jgi:guanylate cyclase 2F